MITLDPYTLAIFAGFILLVGICLGAIVASGCFALRERRSLLNWEASDAG